MKKILSITFFVFLIDLVSKILANSYLTVGKSVVIINNFFSFTLAYNKGIAFSMLEGNLLFIILMTIVVIFFLFSFVKNNVSDKIEIISYSFVIGGAIGNLVDRICYGYVIDFLDFNILGYDYPIFNLADSFIVIGIFMMIIISFKRRGNQNGDCC